MQWKYQEITSLRVNVTMVEEGSSFRVRFCRGIRAPAQNFEGVGCEVERTQ